MLLTAGINDVGDAVFVTNSVLCDRWPWAFHYTTSRTSVCCTTRLHGTQLLLTSKSGTASLPSSVIFIQSVLFSPNPKPSPHGHVIAARITAENPDEVDYMLSVW